MQGLEQLSTLLTNLAYALVFLAIGLTALFALGYAFLLWIRNRNREEYSLSFVTLEVVLPRDNEIKIDAAEQLFASLYSVKNEEWYSFLQSEHAISFEIVGRKEDIRFFPRSSEQRPPTTTFKGQRPRFLMLDFSQLAQCGANKTTPR